MPSYFRTESLPHELRIDISSSELEKVVFTTLDKIFGRIVFSPAKPTIVEDVLIEFLGQANTWIEPRTPGKPRRTSCDEFINMIDEKDFRNKTCTIAEAFHPVRVLPVYLWWCRLHLSRFHERTCASPSVDPPQFRVQKEKLLKTELFGKVIGRLSFDVQAQELYSIKLDRDSTSSSNLCSVSVNLKYTPQSNHPPPMITTISSRLHISVSFSVMSSFQPKLSSKYETSYKLLKSATPATSSCAWRKGSYAHQNCFLTEFVIPLNLPPTAGSSKNKGASVLLPSFECCSISLSYQIELKIGLEIGGNISVRFPVVILAKPGISLAEAEFEEAIRKADSWSAPAYDDVVMGA